MNVRAHEALSTAYTVAGAVTLALALIVMTTGFGNDMTRALVVLGAAVCGLLLLYYFTGDQ